MSNRSAILVGFIVATVIPPSVLATASLFLESSSGSLADKLALFVGAFATFLLPSTALMIVVGLPAFLISSRYDLAKWWSALIVGALTGVSIALARPGNVPYAESFLTYLPIGTITALVFWVVWKLAAVSNQRA